MYSYRFKYLNTPGLQGDGTIWLDSGNFWKLTSKGPFWSLYLLVVSAGLLARSCHSKTDHSSYHAFLAMTWMATIKGIQSKPLLPQVICVKSFVTALLKAASTPGLLSMLSLRRKVCCEWREQLCKLETKSSDISVGLVFQHFRVIS